MKVISSRRTIRRVQWNFFVSLARLTVMVNDSARGGGYLVRSAVPYIRVLMRSKAISTFHIQRQLPGRQSSDVA
jgi:hypothetical protein